MDVSVWAPRATRSVEVVVAGGRRVALAAGAGGRWAGAVPGLAAGDDYALSLDGGPPRPDPRSRWQPAGVHGPSRVVECPAPAGGWTDAGWRGFDLPSAVLYELHVGTFSPEGTFAGAARRLDHLVDLGIDAVEIMPVAAFPGRWGWGYDGVDLWAPHDGYGGPEGLAALVDACHSRGLGVILDVVYNHLGPAGIYLDEFGPYFSGRHATEWGDGLNVDGPGSDEVRSFVLDNACTWLRDYHLDGLRLDAVQAVVDDSMVHILEQLAQAVSALESALDRPLWLVAEAAGDEVGYVRSPAEGGYGLAAQWADDWHHAVHATLTGERAGYYAHYGSLATLARTLRQAWVVEGLPAGLDGGRFVVCAQNHDQVGNRAAGDRLGHLVSPGRARIAAALLLTVPFVPLLFQGEEWGASTPFPYFTDHDDPDLGRAVSEGRRREFAAFGWRPEDVPDPQDPATFARAVLRWDEAGTPAHADLLAWYRSLVALRRSHPALRAGPLDDTEVTWDEAAGWLVAARRSAGVVVAVNLGPDPQDVPVAGAAGHEIALAWPAGGADPTPAGVRLPPDGVAVLTPRRAPEQRWVRMAVFGG